MHLTEKPVVLCPNRKVISKREDLRDVTDVVAVRISTTPRSITRTTKRLIKLKPVTTKPTSRSLKNKRKKKRICARLSKPKLPYMPNLLPLVRNNLRKRKQ